MVKKTDKKKERMEHLAFKTTGYIGSPASLLLHSIFFVGIFSLQWFGLTLEEILLILTTAVSLEAIYLAIFIQMTVNHQAHRLAEVSEDVEDISEDVEEISKDVDEISEDVEEISKDIDDIQEDVEDIQEDVEEMGKEDDDFDKEHQIQQKKIEHMETILKELLHEVRELKDQK